MKYLKIFESFIGQRGKRVSISQEIVDEIKEICVELNDMRNYYTGVDSQKIIIMKGKQSMVDPLNPNEIITFSGEINNEVTYTEEIAEVVIRINDYLDEQGYDLEFVLNGDRTITMYPELGAKGYQFLLYFIKK